MGRPEGSDQRMDARMQGLGWQCLLRGLGLKKDLSRSAGNARLKTRSVYCVIVFISDDAFIHLLRTLYIYMIYTTKVENVLSPG